MQDPLLGIGKNIRASRIKKGLSQEALAKVLKADKAYISRIESGKKNITIKSLVKIANALSLEPRELFL